MKKHFFGIAALVIAMIGFVPLVVSTQGLKDSFAELNKTATKAGVEQEGDIAKVVGSVINVALSLVGLIFLILMVYGGYLWLTSRGDEGQIDKSKEIIRAAIIGLVIVMSAYAITVLVTSRFE